jgi:anaerobic selenocysteine-containing dehydrogenase
MSEVQEIKTVCPHDCPDTCAMLARVQDGRLLSVRGNPDHPTTRGYLCCKVARYEERVYSPDRVLYPHRRVGAKGEGRFERISWDEALETIVTRWQEVIARYRAEAILPYSYAGTMGIVNMSACDGRLWNRMGCTRLLRTICSTAAEAGYDYTMGWSGGIDPESFVDARTIIVWGMNPASTCTHMMAILRDAQKRGATLIVIDPFRTRTAECADWHVHLEHGTDSALALGMMHVIFHEGLHDEEFLRDHTVGWEALRDRVLEEYPPDRVAQITGISAEDIERLAVTYATQRPSAIRLGYGIARNANGGMMVRTITCLPAVIGAWKELGGGLLLSTSAHFPLNMKAVKRPDLLQGNPRAVNMNQLGEALLTLDNPPIMALYVYNCNPAAVAPNSNRVIEGLLREDLFTVVHEQLWTDTARLADIVLPATTQMEHLDLHTSYGHLYVQLNQPAIPPLGESRPNWDVLSELARRMGYTEKCFRDTAEDIIRQALDSDHPFLRGITYEYLLEHGFAKLRTPSDPYAPYLQGEIRFRTPSGKVEFYSQRAKRDGYDPLPVYTPAREEDEAAQRYPLKLMTPAAHHFLNTSFANLERMQKGEREPRIWIHPQDAAARGIQQGDWVRAYNGRGEVLLKAVVSTEHVRPGTTWSPSLWWHRDSPGGRNVNALTSDRLADMGGGSTFHTCFVEIEKV